MLIIFLFEFRNDNHRSKVVFMMDLTYSVCLILLNTLLLLKYEYFHHEVELVDFIEGVISVIVYTGIVLICFKLIWELLPLEFLKNIET